MNHHDPPSAMTMPQWREAITKAIGRLHLTAADESSVRATLRSASLEDVHLFDMHTHAHTVVRDQQLAADAPGAHCKLSLQIAGSATLIQDGRTCVLAPGDLALYVTQRPYELSYPQDQHSLVVLFPQSFVHMSAEQISQVTATRVSRDDGLGRVAVPLFEQLAANIDLLEGAHAMSLMRSSLDMLVTVLSAEAHASGRDTAENILLQQAMACIEENLHDPSSARPRLPERCTFRSVSCTAASPRGSRRFRPTCAHAAWRGFARTLRTLCWRGSRCTRSVRGTGCSTLPTCPRR